ncbi:pyridoxal phosphate-dependent aminotransferase [Roseovarius pelagicus]|uniref:Aminotransferase n=1 Tax=Roseovarius pelagicus TaxID=2980108 RepID=A0ABY6D9E3_9RHOB|nr:pyridoxal phosphate-dependent aminotransferase [Roseovarius pelagicus]UXX82767.1 pyridoxal phosphate-dependent aminotransferase [Roseovarius pelagicus]
MTTISGRLSTRMQAVLPSPTIAMSQTANLLRAEGRSIIDLSSGEPDFDTPENICRAAKAAIDNGKTRYTNVDGTTDLKKAIVVKFLRENGLSYRLDQISVGTGGKQVLCNALLATLNDDDEVIIPAPYWVSYPDMVRLAGGVPVLVPCPAEDRFLITANALRDAITPRTKWLILNSPSNPTGAGYSAARLKALADVLLEHPHVMVMTDDMYEHLRFDGWEFATIAAVEPKLMDRVLTVNGVSKAYAMTGWRIGYAGGPVDIIRAMATLQSQSTSNPSAISQAAAVAALDGPQDFLVDRGAVFEQRRDLCLERIRAIDGLDCVTPNGAFYLFPSCEGLIGRTRPDGKRITTDTDVVMYLLEEAGVATVPGSAFGLAPFFRLSFATSTENLEQACDRMATACAKLT